VAVIVMGTSEAGDVALLAVSVNALLWPRASEGEAKRAVTPLGSPVTDSRMSPV
jgi:hypothetical protein